MKKTLILCLTLGMTAISAIAAPPPENSDDRVFCYELKPALRRVISIPDVDGYLTLKCDFHMHTVFADAQVYPVGRVREAWHDGLDVIAMTEHIGVHSTKGIMLKDYNLPYKLAKKEGDKFGLLVIQGAEITRTKPFGHMNALFLTDCNVFHEDRYVKDASGKEIRDKRNKRIPIRETEMLDFEAAEKQGAFIQWNHPGWPDKKCDMFDLHKRLIKEGRIHAVEIFNNKEWYPKVLDWFDEYKLPMTANTDIHNPSSYEYGDSMRPMTLVFAKEYTLESIKEAMFAGRIVAFFDQKLAGDAEWLEKLVRASLKVRVINAEKGVVEITNNSDIEFSTYFTWHMNPVVFYPHKAVRIDLPKGTEVEFANCFTGRKPLKIELW